MGINSNSEIESEIMGGNQKTLDDTFTPAKVEKKVAPAISGSSQTVGKEQTSFMIKGTGSLAKHYYESVLISKPTEKAKFDCHNQATGKPCPSYANNKDCIHSNKALQLHTIQKLENAIGSSDYFRTRWERELESRFHSFEAFHEYCWEGRGKPEVVYLSNLFMALLFCEEDNIGNTDLIHYAVQEKFQANPKINGSVIRRLTEAKFIEYCGYEVKSEREICHHAPKKMYKLTEKGKDIIEAIT